MKVAFARAVVCLSLWLSVGHVRGFNTPAKMNWTIQNLLQHYKIQPKYRFDGKPVFPRDLLKGRMEVKMLFMGGVLETYEKLIDQMLDQLPTPGPQTSEGKAHPVAAVSGAPSSVTVARSDVGNDVRAQLSYIRKMIHDLRKHNYQEQEKFLQGIYSLRNIQVDNLVVQSKALWELPWLYEEASSLSDNRMQKRRRRRQARRAKSRLRATKQFN
ncbi:interferon gamma-like [Mastacembelus armatus]|uniref:Interferon gamma-like n=1 Tax=Mastacembelus armatus TaxID=205130 RepID=A0A3Q3MUA0_9TELE|nr:interferon gamma-like [Mastacembelus armatus]